MKTPASPCLLITIVVAFACGGGGATPDAPPASCQPGDKVCRADGLYTCDANRTFQRTEACTACEATPTPHCAVSCEEPGVVAVCENGAVKTCATGATAACDPGTCVTAGKDAVCATPAGTTTCEGRRGDGSPYVLACADANGVAPVQVCDRRSGECVTAAFDCATLDGVPAGELACDASGHYYSACIAGQPRALTCATGTTCAADGKTNCYTAPTEGVACGASAAVCYPGMHCVQESATVATCDAPAGQIACSNTDVLAVCTDLDTGVACVNGTVWWWRNLSTWGGSCTSNHANLGLGGLCIPGLGDCLPGLACRRSPYDVAGICSTPEPDAPAECTLTGQASTGRSCLYDWHACRDGHRYDIDCRLVNIGGNVLTLCDCSIDGAWSNTVMTDAF